MEATSSPQVYTYTNWSALKVYIFNRMAEAAWGGGIDTPVKYEVMLQIKGLREAHAKVEERLAAWLYHGGSCVLYYPASEVWVIGWGELNPWHDTIKYTRRGKWGIRSNKFKYWYSIEMGAKILEEISFKEPGLLEERKSLPPKKRLKGGKTKVFTINANKRGIFIF